jgi:3-oxoacyl-[acyl-carrier-protein] synthase II
MDLKRVVVTGIGAITPIGKTVPEFWDGLRNGVSGADFITRFDPVNHKTKFACEVKNYDPLTYFDRKEARKIDLFTQFALIAAEEAFKDSGLTSQTYDPDRSGVIIGSGTGGINTLAEELEGFYSKPKPRVPRFSPFFIPKFIADIAAGYISIKYDFRGPNFATISACASSAHAIIESYNYIRLGLADIILTGGAEAPINEPAVAGFNAMRAISTRNDDPKTASRPFDKDRDGFVMAEGAGILVLEEYEHAVKRGAKIYAELVGIGATADAYHITAPHPEGRGAAKVMELALKDANIQPSDIDYINVHGTSTKLGDLAEIKAVKQVFGEHAYELSISSTKSMTGHLLGAAGAVEAIASILAIQNNLIPPTINLFNLDPEIDPNLDLTPNHAKEKTVHYALSNTFGFGGHNATLIFKKLD